jgi:plastocyanin
MTPVLLRTILAAGTLAIVAASADAQSMDHAMPGMDHMTPSVARVAVVPVAGPDQVVIANFAFGPATLTVPRGTTVTWINQDEDAHTVTAAGDKPMFKSPPLDTGDRYAFKFDTPGTYTYFCSIHPAMRGTVVVR